MTDLTEVECTSCDLLWCISHCTNLIFGCQTEFLNPSSNHASLILKVVHETTFSLKVLLTNTCQLSTTAIVSEEITRSHEFYPHWTQSFLLNIFYSSLHKPLLATLPTLYNQGNLECLKYIIGHCRICSMLRQKAHFRTKVVSKSNSNTIEVDISANVEVYGAQKPHNLYVWLILLEFIVYSLNYITPLVSLVCDLASTSVRELTCDELVLVVCTSTVCSWENEHTCSI